MKKTVSIPALLLLAACAAKPENIQASYISPMTYDGYSCSQLLQESSRIESALVTASKKQNDARTGDTIGVILLGLPVSSLSGSAVAPEIAKLKGEKNTLQQTLIAKNCQSDPTL